jgi:hypothetical protein
MIQSSCLGLAELTGFERLPDKTPQLLEKASLCQGLCIFFMVNEVSVTLIFFNRLSRKYLLNFRLVSLSVSLYIDSLEYSVSEAKAPERKFRGKRSQLHSGQIMGGWPVGGGENHFIA